METSDKNQGLEALQAFLNQDDQIVKDVQLLQDVKVQIQFAVQFEKSAGLQRAEDTYLKVFGEIALAVVELGQLQSQLGSQYKPAKQWLKKIRELVQERLECLKSLKNGNATDFQSKKKGKKAKIHKWAEKYSSLLQDIKRTRKGGKRQKMVEKVLESDEVSQEEPSSPKMEAKQEKEAVPREWMKSITSMGTGETISKGVSQQIHQHFDNLQEKYELGGTLRGLKKGEVKIHKDKYKIEGDPAFTVWFSYQQKQFTLNPKTLFAYESALKCILYPTEKYVDNSKDKKMEISTLITQLRKSFHIEVPMHEKILLKIHKECSNDTTVQVLAGELEARIALLDNHPFYTKSSFKNEQSYQIWKKVEQEEINKIMKSLGIEDLNHKDKRTYVRPTKLPNLMEIFTPSTRSSDSTPTPISSPIDIGDLTIESEEHHKCYLQLVSALIAFESMEKNSKSTPTDAPKEIATLPNHWIWLLDQYGKIFGVGKLYRKVVYLDILAQSFDHTGYHIELMHNALLDVINSVKDQKMVMTNHEENLLSISIEILYAQMKSRIAHYRAVFPAENKSQLQALEKMIKLWRYVLQLDNLLKQKDVSLNTMVEDCINRSIDIEYQSMLMRAEKLLKESHEEIAANIISTEKMLLILDMISDELSTNLLPYVEVLKQYINLEERALNYYHSILGEEISQYCERLIDNKNPNNPIDASVFELFSKVSEFNSVCAKKVKKLTPYPLSKLFEPFVVIWINQTSGKLMEWTREAFKLDNWEPIDSSSPFSSSVLDVFCMLSEPLKLLHKLKDFQDQANFMHLFGMVMDGVICQYVSEILAQIENDIPIDLRSRLLDMLDKLETNISARTPRAKLPSTKSIISEKLRKFSISGKKEKAIPETVMKDVVTITQKMSILANNIETAKIKLSDLDDSFNNELAEVCSETFRTLTSSLNKVLGSIAFRMNEYVFPLLKKTVSMDTKKRVEELEPMKEILVYLDSQLDEVTAIMYPILSKRLLKMMWETLMNDLLDLIMPPNNPKASIGGDQADILEDIVQILIDFFHASGVGLSDSYLLKGSTAFIRSILGLFICDTESLIDMFAILQQSNKTGKDLLFTTNHILNVLAGRTNDKVAQKFVKQTK